MIIVSPWTRGGWVNSQLFDHTSLIKFLEARFAHRNRDLVEANITPWRRAVVGDLTSAFDFKTPNRSRPVRLPDTDDFKPDELVRFADEVPVPPADQRLPKQEHGVKPARALPYELHATARRASTEVTIDFRNTGRAAAVFQVRESGSTAAPRTYTVEAGKQLADAWAYTGEYDLSVHGPNGFFRRFAGGSADVEIKPAYDRDLTLRLTNHGRKRVEVTVRDVYKGRTTRISLRPGETERREWPLDRTQGWYDLTVTVEGDPRFRQQLAGHVENGEDSITDPALGGLV